MLNEIVVGVIFEICNTDNAHSGIFSNHVLIFIFNFYIRKTNTNAIN
jgi:hypothetical protein